MFNIRRSQDRGQTSLDWLESQHSFSFGRYMDPQHMGFGPLRVINEDRVTGGAGFATHEHANMEILSIVLDGALEHKDSLGQSAVIRPGDIQRMSAGTGVRHSEYNASATEPVHFLQIWIVPECDNIQPSYEQKEMPRKDRAGQLKLLGSRDGRDGSITIHRDVDLYGAVLSSGGQITHPIAEGRGVWVQVVSGAISVRGETLRAGDGLALRDEPAIDLSATANAELLLFDLTM